MTDVQEIADKQGWTDSTLLDLCLEYIGNQQSDDAFIEFLQEKADESDEVITTGSFVFRSSQLNGDYADCKSCGTRLDDDRHHILTNKDGFAFCSPECILADHDNGETLHAYDGPMLPDSDGAPPACITCGDTPDGLMHSNTERNIEPLLWEGE